MDIYKKDNLERQINNEIRFLKKNIIQNTYQLNNLQKGGNISIIEDIYKEKSSHKDDILNIQNIQITEIQKLIKYLDKNLLSDNLTNKMRKEAKHAKVTLQNELNKINKEKTHLLK
jgi:hypothetical protein